MTSSHLPEWYKRGLEIERSHNGSIGAGLMAHHFEKHFVKLSNAKKRHLVPLNFYYFVHFSRRKRQLSVSDLAQQSGVDFEEIMALERNTQYKLKSESVIKLAKFFGVNQNALIKMARLNKPQIDPVSEANIEKFPYKVGSTEELGDVQLMITEALEEFLSTEPRRANLDCAG